MLVIKGATSPELFVFVWALFSFCLYIFILTFLIKFRKTDPFTATFFQLFISAGFADLAGSIHVFGTKITKQWGLVDWGPLFYDPRFGRFFRLLPTTGALYFSWNQYIAILAIGFNRYCELIHPEKWTSKVHKYTLIAQWVIPFLIVSPRLAFDPQIYVKNVSGIQFLSPITPQLMPFYGIFVILSLPLITNIVASILYIRMFIYVRNLNIEFLTDEYEGKIRLAIVGFTLFILMALLEVLVLGQMIAGITKRPLMAVVFSKMTNQTLIVFSLCNPWILLFCSRSTRQAIVAWLRPARAYHATVHPIIL